MGVVRKAKVIETEDDELAIQLTNEELESLNWKTGDDIEWSETENGFKLTKTESNNMKKLSNTYKKLGIDFTFPIEIKDAKGKETYFENSDGYWCKKEYDAQGNETYFENSDGFWCKREYGVRGRRTYYEDSDGYKEGTPRSHSCASKVIEVDGKKYKLTEL